MRYATKGKRSVKLKLHIRNIAGRTLVKKGMVKVGYMGINGISSISCVQCSMCYIHGRYGMTTLNNTVNIPLNII